MNKNEKGSGWDLTPIFTVPQTAKYSVTIDGITVIVELQENKNYTQEELKQLVRDSFNKIE